MGEKRRFFRNAKTKRGKIFFSGCRFFVVFGFRWPQAPRDPKTRKKEEKKSRGEKIKKNVVFVVFRVRTTLIMPSNFRFRPFN